MANNFQAAQDVIRAMRASGQKDDVIADRIKKSANLDDNVKAVFAKAKSTGMSKKAVDDFLALPVSQPLISKESISKSLSDAEGGVLGFLGDVTGTKKLGRYLGAKAAMLDPSHRENLAEIAKTDAESARQLSRGGVSNMELAGSIAQTGLSLVAPFAGKALSTGNIASRTLKSAGMGAAFGAAGAATEEKDLLSGATTGAMIGGAIPVVGAAGKYVASRFPKLLGIFTGESDEMIKAALRDPAAADKAIRAGDSELRRVVEKGSMNSIRLRDEAIIEQANAMKKIAGTSGAKVKRLELVDNFRKILEANDIKVNKAGLDFTESKVIANAGEVGQIQKAWNALRAKQGNSLDFANAQKFKQLVGKLTRYADDAGVPAKSPTLAKIYDRIDDLIKTSLPKTSRSKYAAANKKFSESIELFDDLVDAFNKGDPFSKLAQVGGKNKDTLRQLMEFYQKETGEDVLATVAGRELAMEKSSSGLLGTGLGFRNFFDFLISPQAQARAVVKAGAAGQRFEGALERPLSKTLSNLRNVPAEELNLLGRTLKKLPPDKIGEGVRKVGRSLTGSTISAIGRE